MSGYKGCFCLCAIVGFLAALQAQVIFRWAGPTTGHRTLIFFLSLVLATLEVAAVIGVLVVFERRRMGKAGGGDGDGEQEPSDG